MIIGRSACCFAALVLLASPKLASAQNPSYPGQPAGAPTTSPTPAPPPAAVRVMRASRASTPISIDGKLTEPAWSTAVPSGDFTQSYPKIGAPPTDPTE